MSSLTVTYIKPRFGVHTAGAVVGAEGTHKHKDPSMVFRICSIDCLVSGM